MAIKIKKNGKIEQFTLHSTDVKVLDLEGKFKKKDLESVIREISDTEHIHIGEVDTSKDGIWIDDREILDNAEDNGVVERLKSFVNETIGELSSLTTSIKSNLVGAINELKGNVDQLSNPNLLINGDFQINQRDKTGYIREYGDIYTVDRWATLRNQNIVEVEDRGIKVTCDEVSAGIVQPVELPKNCIGQYMTISFKLGEVTGTVNANMRNNEWDVGFGNRICTSKDSNSIVSYTVKLNDDTYPYYVVAFERLESERTTFELEWVKLELGSVATPFVPRSYGEELALCQRYYRVLEFKEYTFNWITNIYGRINWPPLLMRTTPTLTITNDSSYIDYGNSESNTGLTYRYTLSKNGQISGVEFSHTKTHTVGSFSRFSGTIKLEAEIY